MFSVTGGGGVLWPFVLRVVAGACVGRRTGQPRMPPQERLHEEVFVLGIVYTPPELGNDIELFHPRRRAVSCEAALRILSSGESCPPCGGDSGYFHSACAK